MEKTEYYRMKVSEVFASLGTSEKGLNSEDADKRLIEFGTNELSADSGVPKWILFLSQFKDLLVIVLIAAAAISFTIGSYRDAMVMVVIVLINAGIGYAQEFKVSRILESLKTLIDSPAKVLRSGELAEIPQKNLVPGDIVQIEAGDKIPADIRIIESYDLRTEEFALTGESMPVGKITNAISEESVIGDRENMAFTGTTVTSGSAKGVVVRTGMDTETGKIAGMTEATTDIPSPLERELTGLARLLTVIVVVIASILFGVAMWQEFSFLTSMIYALGIAVALVPQALPAQVTVALSATSKRLAEKSVVVKNLPSVETLGSTSVISTDKTGTLTKNEMTVTRVWFDGRHYEMTGTGYEPKGQIKDDSGKDLDQAGVDAIEIMMDAATMASNAEIHQPDEDHPGWYPVGDPTEAALVTMSTKLGKRSPIEDEENTELQEFPFDSERKMMSSVRQFGDRQQLAMKGALDSILAISKYIYRNGKAERITEDDKKAISSINEEFSRQALRVLAIAYRPLDPDGRDYEMEEVEKDVIFLGLTGMIDPPREGVKEALLECHDAGIRTFIMTGDHAITAQAIGKEIGLSDSESESLTITGKELKEISDDKLSIVMKENNSIIFSRVDPEDKLRIVQLLEDSGEVVAVTGDGINDAPALKKADIGVAMGRIGTDVAKEASELILLDDSFPTLVEAVREGRTIYRNLKKTVLASLTTNLAELFVVLLGLAAVSMRGWAIPILAIQILAIDLLAEIMPLTFLTYDPPSEDIMNRPPRSLSDHIVNKWSFVEVIFLGLVIGGLSFVNYALFMSRSGTVFSEDSPGSMLYSTATTIAYLTIAFCQFVNILSRRYEHRSIFSMNFFTNRILLLSIIASALIMLAVIYTPTVQDFLQFRGPGLVDWFYILGAAAVYLIIFEILKSFKRSLRKNTIEENSEEKEAAA
ncbi:MAG: cation-translocating P-type ATPase [Candidatus Krumholzibacteriota bacterium]|nr:cation-translocating P-type ATPase [Candidatus Krumholzibacteriota bacterium]